MEHFRFRSWRTRLRDRTVGNQVLEVGIGTGKNLPHHPQNVQIIAIDLGAMSRRKGTISIGMIRMTTLISAVCIVLFIPLTTYADDVHEEMIKAAHRGDIATVKALLAKGAYVDARLEYSGWTALMLAAGEGHTELVKFLLAKGAEVNARSFVKNTSLIRAAVNGHTETVKFLLANCAEVNARGSGGFTALMLAAQCGYSDIVKVLLANGADVNMKSDLDDTALSRAMDNSHTETIRILKEAGARG